MKVLNKQQIIAMHAKLMAGTGGDSALRSEALLDAALTGPFSSYGGNDLFPTLRQKAARLGCGLIKSQAFADGCKRLAAHATIVFLAINGIELQYEQQELADIFLKVASDEASCDELAAWIREHEGQSPI